MIAAILRVLAHPWRTLGEKWADADRKLADWGAEAWWDE